MANILVVTGSVRPNSANSKVVPVVVDALEAKGQTVTIADLKEINLPFFDAPVPPTSPDFTPSNDAARQWTQLVADADGVVLVTPEYNHTMSPVQLNAIDWVGKEWEDKPVALIGYGWRSGAAQAHATAREALAVNLKAKIGDDETNMFFMQDLNADGSVLNAESVSAKINASIDELIEMIG